MFLRGKRRIKCSKSELHFMRHPVSSFSVLFYVENVLNKFLDHLSLMVDVCVRANVCVCAASEEPTRSPADVSTSNTLFHVALTLYSVLTSTCAHWNAFLLLLLAHSTILYGFSYETCALQWPIIPVWMCASSLFTKRTRMWCSTIRKRSKKKENTRVAVKRWAIHIGR